MSDAELAPAKGPGAQLRPAGELRRPDLHGQLPHIFTTMSPNKPIGELELEDIVEINWAAVTTSIQDALIRVRHEGDLTSTTVRDTIRLTALALKKLEIDDAQLVRILNSHPGIGFLGWWFSFLPTETGMKLRNIRLEQKQLKHKREALGGYRAEIFSLRKQLATEVDAKIDMRLSGESAEYQTYLRQLAVFHHFRAMVDGMLEDIAEYWRLERISDRGHGSNTKMEQLRQKFPGFVRMCRSMVTEISGVDPFEGILDKKLTWGDLDTCLRQIKAYYDAMAMPIERPMAGLRDAKKQEIYGELGTQP